MTTVSRSQNPRRDDDPAFAMHRGGKLHVTSSVDVRDQEGLSLAYTPGVARVCDAIAESPELVDTYTWKSNLVAVVTDGTAVLGLGDIGAEASLPVMEGKSLLFKQFAGVDSVPIALGCTGVDEIVETVVRMAPSFGGINLEDISAPRCFEIERQLRERLDIPVFHDDQHGTAIVTVAALRNAARFTGRTLADLRAVVSGAGAAGVAVTKMLVDGGIGDIAVADSKGMIYEGREGLTPVKRELASISNRAGLRGSIESALEGADVFIGLSAGEVPESVVATMADDAIIFAMANPNPEVHPDVARRHASVVATGRSDFPNQINNVLAFPGVFRGAFDAGATDITENMKLAAATALADLVGDKLSADYIIPSPFDERVAPAVAAAVAAQAREDGVVRG
ncbi:NAD-dependent malic enzyme [Nocardiopsis dassonvillei]|uniref:Malate dehydrogenase (Oxaloacetate-decarboxylating) n=2 Tax=Nocardiopsidaceae TaxID=83676 RepID=D7B562_NOCDD|nr:MULTISPECIES: malic enzyme-like NAD(P)-binding protein [Nocardiopsis]ADH69083.1 Malate dehydrogenase (oxaloacetate-decarboxylating) [Nocardiopsis dassonvillei subsp. dassonvillei DSM 43111]NKY78373.1 NAD-dependent malic enzyme [Nocardiopsis dassonvillei]VEI89593.1 NADP-dependent malic enzyme [Nocardiopsis dassonvillei]